MGGHSISAGNLRISRTRIFSLRVVQHTACSVGHTLRTNLATPYGEIESALASRKESVRDPNCMRNRREEMPTPLDAPCCCKPVQQAHRLAKVRRRWWQHVLREPSEDRLVVDLASNSAGRESPEGLGVGKAEALESGASAPVCPVPEVPLRWRGRRECACGGS
jgi:hypothetical protein